MKTSIDTALHFSPKGARMSSNSSFLQITDVELKRKLGEGKSCINSLHVVGNFGEVYLAMWHGAPVAAKKLKGEAEWKAFQREAELLE